MSVRTVELKRLDPRLGSAEFPLPDYATIASAGMDLRAMIETPLKLEAGASALVPSGLAIHIGDPGLCAVVCRARAWATSMAWCWAT
jgi:dUTP pyrophosphatase